MRFYGLFIKSLLNRIEVLNILKQLLQPQNEFIYILILFNYGLLLNGFKHLIFSSSCIVAYSHFVRLI